MISPAARLLWAAVFVAVPLCAAAGLPGAQQWPCVVVLGLLAILAAVDAFRGSKRLTSLAVEVRGASEQRWFETHPAKISITIQGEAGRYQIALAMPGGIVAEEPSLTVVLDGTSRQIEIAARPEKRGHYEIPNCFVRAWSPAGLWQIRGEKPLRLAIRVYPDLESEPGAKVLFHRLRTGLRHQPPAGRGREFERLREYAVGDSYEEIAWKATARRGRPVVRVFQVERTQDVYAIVDASRLSGRDERLERYIRAALLLALAAENEGDNFGLVAFDDRVVQFVRAARGAHHFARCRDALYNLHASRKTPDFRELFTTLQLRIRRRALLFFLTGLDDPLLSENFLDSARVLARKHVTVVGHMKDSEAQPLFAGDAPENAAIYARLAGHMRWATLEETTQNLHRAGVGVLHLTAETAAMNLIARYSEIKRRQIL